jgi:bifunctional DNase/RNase
MQNTLNIDSKIAIKSVQIFDLQGRKVIEKSDVTVESVEVNSLSTGIYFAKLKTDQGHFKMMKLIKE